MPNKVKYGLTNVYYSVATEGLDGTITYATPVRMKGAVNLQLDPSGDTNPFYADNILYFQSTANNGYTGTLEIARINDDFKKDVLKEREDRNGIMVEYSGEPTVEFALLFQFEGDVNKTRHCIYRCTAARPSVAGATTEASITPQTETLEITSMPRISDKLVKSKCEDTQTTQYDSWFTTVYIPTFEE